MVEKIIAKIISDRECPVCGVKGYYVHEGQAKKCKACDGKGFDMSKKHVALLIQHPSQIKPSILESLRTQNIVVVKRDDDIVGRTFSAIYALDMYLQDPLFLKTLSRLTASPSELHCFFS